MAQQTNRFKIVLVGDAKVGKTTFIDRHLTGEFTKDYVPTLGFNVHPLLFNTNYGTVIFDTWDVGQPGLFDAYCMQAKATILFFDVQNRDSYKNLGEWLNKVNAVVGEIPLVVCGNKVDVEDRKVAPREITFHRKHNAMYYDISVKSNYNYEKPFLYLARKLTGHQDLEFGRLFN